MPGEIRQPYQRLVDSSRATTYNRIHEVKNSNFSFLEITSISLLCMISVGSFVFHIYPKIWTKYLDIIPSILLMIVVAYYVSKDLLRRSSTTSSAVAFIFFVTTYISTFYQCDNGKFGIDTSSTFGFCLNGAIINLPALIFLLTLSIIITIRGDKYRSHLIVSAVLFIIAILFRAIDHEICNSIRILNYKVGTHFLWHIFAAATVFYVLNALLCQSRRSSNDDV